MVAAVIEVLKTSSVMSHLNVLMSAVLLPMLNTMNKCGPRMANFAKVVAIVFEEVLKSAMNRLLPDQLKRAFDELAVHKPINREHIGQGRFGPKAHEHVVTEDEAVADRDHVAECCCLS